MRIVFLDTETGGLNPLINSLLSIGLVIWEDGEIKLKKEFFVKEDEYNVTPEAMRVNNINLEDLRKKGNEKSEIKKEIIKIIKENFNEKAILAGHNISFDISFLKQIFNEKEFLEIFSYRSIDTASILKYISIKKNLSLNSLDDAIKYYNLKIEKRHTALDDAVVTAEIFTKLLEE
ncbi:3'-5' exonuclease [Cetobacterium sp.]|uniref:3'-5' exonuclease n=1 Tax=Cetobacterium sp. TaxID=2071632 RepID=UPI003F307D6D